MKAIKHNDILPGILLSLHREHGTIRLMGPGRNALCVRIAGLGNTESYGGEERTARACFDEVG